MIVDMFEYCQWIKEHHISIVYSGPIWADGLEGLADTLKKRLKFDGLPLSASQSIFSVFIEQMNNMLMYSEGKEHFKSSEEHEFDISTGAFLLGKQSKTYFLQSGNIMKTENSDLLKTRIDHLNTLDKAELRKYYKEQIRNEDKDPASKGAGLGLIEIAKRASSKIAYTFRPIDDSFTFFTMFVTIGQRED